MADAVHLAVNISREGGEPFVIDDQGFDLVFGELGVMGECLVIELRLGELDLFFEVGFNVTEFEPAIEHSSFIFGLLVGFDFLKTGGDVGFEFFASTFLPSNEVGVHVFDKAGEFGVIIDAGLDGGLITGQIQIAGAVFFEQGFFKTRADIPVTIKGIDIRSGNTALEMAGNVLKVFRRLAVNVSREVEIELIFFDLIKGNHASELGDINLFIKDIDDFVNVLITKSIFWAVFGKAAAGIDHEQTLFTRGPQMCFGLVDDDDAGWNPCAIEEVRGETDDAFDVSLADKVSSDLCFCIPSKEGAMGEDAGSFAGGLE